MAQDTASTSIDTASSAVHTPIDEATLSELKRLKSKRGHKRGNITRLSKRLDQLLKKVPATVTPAAIESLGNELKEYITKHDELQDEIDACAPEPYEVTDEDERVKHDEIHERLLEDLEKLTLTSSIHRKAHILMRELKSLLSLGSAVASQKDDYARVAQAKTDLHSEILALPDNAEVQTLFDRVSDLFSELRHLVASSTPTPTATPSSTTSSSTSHDRPRMAPLNLEIPKFSGDPLQWEAFELSLVSLLKHRAEGFSDHDKFAIIRQSILPPQGKTLIADKLKSGASVDGLLKELRNTYGRPQLVIPILVKKITEPPRTDNSASSLRTFKESVLDPYRALESHLKGDLGLFLPHFLRPYLEGKLREDWDRLLFEKLPKPSMKDLGEFVAQRLLWADTQARPGQSHSSSTNASSTTSSTTPSHHTSSSNKKKSATPAKCASCGEAHWLGRCPAFIALDIESRNRLVREKMLCLNCLSPTHAVRQCNNRHSCRHCDARHHSLLHREQRPGTGTQPTPSTAPPSVAVVDTPTGVAQPKPVSSENGYFTCTVVARLQHEGKFTRARVLLDHGSGGSFISEELATLLKLPRTAQDKLFTGFGQGSVRSKFKVTTQLLSTTSTFATNPIQLSIIPHAFQTSPPAGRDAVLSRATNHGLTLSDTLLGGKVDVILGGEYPWDLCGETITDGPYRFIATKFGYGAVGPLSSPPSVLTIVEQDSSLKDDLAKLWALDKVPESSPLTPDEQEAMDTFVSTTSLQNGRVEVTLPIKKKAPPLGDSRRQALSRFFRNEESLSRKGKLSAFNDALREYIDMGHAHIIPQDQLHVSSSVYYMPVHGVFKPSSTTTKVRPVFDASAKTTTGYSLNDCLHVGPNLYPQLADVLLQFRQHPVGLSADISKMFREIRLASHQQDLHRFLLRQSDGKLVDCRMERVTFGVASSPFLATQTLRFLADTFESEFPRAAHLIRTVFYVDDFVSGADSVQEADSIRTELCGLLAKAGMNLRKWRSNSKQFLENTPPSLREVEPTPLQLQESPKALGAHWDTTNDSLHIAIPSLPSPEAKVTKRVVASVSASVFDVMGLFAPTTILPRMLLQETWKIHFPWDKPLPEELLQSWSSWISDLHHIRDYSIPRQFFDTAGPHAFTSIHGFSDASAKAYGAAIYLRVVTTNGSVLTSLVTAKARVLPTKHVTIPRAELLGAHLMARLLAHTSDLLGVSQDNIYTWTDSSIVLHWLSKDASQLRDRFVANRVQACQELLPHTKWKHVRSEDNPADLASRGVSASDLVHSSLWWAGPRWLSEAPDGWPVLRLTRPPESVQVLSISPSFAIDSTSNDFLNQLWARFSSLFTLERVVAWIFRFYRRLKFKAIPTSYTLTSTELRISHFKLIRLSQSQDFPEVIGAIKQDKVLPTSHSLHKLLPTLKDEIIYLKSRVRDSISRTSPKLLIPLHTKSLYTRLLLRSSHVSHLHPGVSALQSILSDKFYIAGLRNLLKKLSRTCPSCQRAYAWPLSHQMGMLPSVRTTPSPPFMKVGVDFAGPLHIRRGYTRKPVVEKCYVAVFVCMATKAVHLELCASLSSEDFLATLSRFIARRGCPSDVYSDNGSNFVGAREEIRELEALLGSRETQEKTTHFAQRNGIQWHNIPPRAPHFGGLWEAAVRTMKLLLKKNLSPHLLRFDELYTLVTEAESILNSRPLTPIKQEEVSLGQVLTAGHFLVGRPLRAPPTSDPPTGKITTLRRWRLVACLKDDLWRAWLRSYLQSQNDRNKWIRPQQPLQVNDLVYIKDEVLKHRTWPLARVIQTFPGDDGQVRAVKLLCGGKQYVRAVQLLIKLHPDDDDSNSTSPTEQV